MWARVTENKEWIEVALNALVFVGIMAVLLSPISLIKGPEFHAATLSDIHHMQLNPANLGQDLQQTKVNSKVSETNAHGGKAGPKVSVTSGIDPSEEELIYDTIYSLLEHTNERSWEWEFPLEKYVGSEKKMTIEAMMEIEDVRNDAGKKILREICGDAAEVLIKKVIRFDGDVELKVGENVHARPFEMRYGHPFHASMVALVIQMISNRFLNCYASDLPEFVRQMWNARKFWIITGKGGKIETETGKDGNGGDEAEESENREDEIERKGAIFLSDRSLRATRGFFDVTANESREDGKFEMKNGFSWVCKEERNDNLGKYIPMDDPEGEIMITKIEFTMDGDVFKVRTTRVDRNPSAEGDPGRRLRGWHHARCLNGDERGGPEGSGEDMTVFGKVMASRAEVDDLDLSIMNSKEYFDMNGIFRVKRDEGGKMINPIASAVPVLTSLGLDIQTDWEGIEIEYARVGKSRGYKEARASDGNVNSREGIKWLHKFMYGYVLQVLKNVKTKHPSMEDDERMYVITGYNSARRGNVFVVGPNLGRIFRGLVDGCAMYYPKMDENGEYTGEFVEAEECDIDQRVPVLPDDWLCSSWPPKTD